MNIVSIKLSLFLQFIITTYLVLSSNNVLSQSITLENTLATNGIVTSGIAAKKSQDSSIPREKFSAQVLSKNSVNSPVQTEEKNIEEVSVVSNRLAKSQSDLLGSVSLINTRQLELINPTHITESLRAIPGLNYQRGSGQEMLPAIRSAVLTGPGACGNTLVMEDGLAVRAAGLCNINELFDTHFEHAQTIEVLRGPQHAFYGSNGINGSINVTLANETKNSVSLETGGFGFKRLKNQYAYGSVNRSNQTKNAGAIYLTVTDDDGFRDASGYSQQKLSLRHAYQQDALRLKVGFTSTHLDQQTAGFLLGLDSYRDNALFRTNPNPEAFRTSRSTRLWSDIAWSMGQEKSVTIKPYLRSTDMDFLLHFLPGKPLEENSQSGFGWLSSFSYSPEQAWQLSMGYDADFSRGQLKQSQANPTQGSAFLQATIPTGLQYDYSVKSQQHALFAHLDYRWGTKASVHTGLRYEVLDYAYDNRMLSGRTRDDGSVCGFGGCRYSRPADREDRFTHVSPSIEFHYQLSKAVLLRASLADAFRSPQATELYRLQREQSSADLDTVEAFNSELGLEWKTDHTDLDIVMYRVRQDNTIIRDSDFFNINGQALESKGLEVGLNHSLNTAWRIQFAGHLARHRYTNNPTDSLQIKGNEVDTAPSFTGNLALHYHPIKYPQSRLALELQQVSDYYLDIDNIYEYPGHRVVNIFTEYALSKRLTLGARLNNIFDTRYANRADFTRFTGERYFPGMPRSLFVSLSWDYE